MPERLYGIAVCLMCHPQLMTIRNSKLKCRTAGGWDLLTTEHIMACWFRVDENIDFVFNAMIKRLHVP